MFFMKKPQPPPPPQTPGPRLDLRTRIDFAPEKDLWTWEVFSYTPTKTWGKGSAHSLDAALTETVAAAFQAAATLDLNPKKETQK